MRCSYACRSIDHVISRRSFLGGMAAGLGVATGFSRFIQPAVAADLERRQKQILCIFLYGGSSQLETWDPKPKTETGGPFRAIETSVPGIWVSELLPKTASLMHHLALVRSINTREDDHARGQYLMNTGRPQTPGQEHPHLGSLASQFLAPSHAPLPGYISIRPGGGGLGGGEAAFLGPKHAPLYLGNGQPPSNTERPESITDEAELARHDLRRSLNDRFLLNRRTAATEAYTSSYEQALQLMERREVFDVSKEPARDVERYGSHDFGRHCLLARRLLEAGVTFVQVMHSNYDTHNENFAFHLELIGEFDQGFSNLLGDLADRGRLDNTLVVVMSEFGRTPKINLYYGRDHWSASWSIALAGSGINPGMVVGKTNDTGTEVVDREVHAGHLFHTYLEAVGLDPLSDYEVNGRPIQIAEPGAMSISELLA